MEIGISLIKMDIAHFTLVNLEILAVHEVIWTTLDTVTLKLIEDESQCQK